MSLENGMVYKLDVYTLTSKPNDGAAHILYYESGSLAAYASANGFGHEETEVTFMGKTETALSAMLGAHKESGKVKELLAIANRDDSKQIKWLGASGFEYSNTEYRMVFNKNNFSRGRKRSLSIKDASIDDSGTILDLDAAAFGADNACEVSQQDLLATKISFLDGEAVGKMRIDEHSGVFGIYGFVMKQNCRGKGLGREFLGEVLENLSASSFSKIYLEVAPENSRALKLYESLAFHTEAVFDYYREAPSRLSFIR
jgi:ribosomal protein S18 acetylase RimI-like enzyme